MLGFGRDGLERRLRASRPNAPEALVAAIAEKVAPRPRLARASRISFAASATVLVLGVFASFGGIGYAASASEQTVHAVKQIAVHHSLVVKHTSAGSQYNQPKPSVGKPAAKPSANIEAAAKPPTANGTLPFTGISLGATVALSLFLMALGVFLRRRGQKDF